MGRCYSLNEIIAMNPVIDTTLDNEIIVNSEEAVVKTVKRAKLKDLSDSDLQKFGVVMPPKKVRKKLRCFSDQQNDELARKSIEELAATIANSLCDTFTFGVKGDRLYIYDEKYGDYKPCSLKAEGTISLKKLVMNLDDVSCNKFALRENILTKIHDILLLKNGVCEKLEKQKDHLVNLENGVLDLKTGALLQHNPKYHCMYHLNACYYRDSRMSDESYAFISHLSGYSEVGFKSLMQMTGLALSNIRSWQYAGLLVGPPGCGKSTFTNLVAEVMSPGSVHSIEYDSFKKRTNRIDFVDAQIGICTDIQEDAIPKQVVAAFKQVACCETIRTRYLYHEAADYTPNLFLILCGNDLPVIEDGSGAFERRLITIYVGDTIDSSIRDANMLEKLLLDKDAIVSEALDYIAAVYNKLDTLERLPVKLTVETSNSKEELKTWFDEHIESCEGSMVTMSALLEDFNKYAEHPLTLNGFAAKFRKAHPEIMVCKKKNLSTAMDIRIIKQTSNKAVSNC